jgi:chromosome segregation ATPase
MPSHEQSEIGEMQLLESDVVGRAALLPLDNRRVHRLPGRMMKTRWVSLRTFNAPEELLAAVRLMLGQTLIVRDRATARRLLNDLPTHARIVTLRGEVFRGDGLIIAGKSAGGSALSRPRQKRELSESLAALSAQIESVNREVDGLSSQIAEAQRELTRADGTTRAARVRLDEAQANERQAGLESESARRQLEWQKSQHGQLEAEAAEASSIRQNLVQSQSDVENQTAEQL